MLPRLAPPQGRRNSKGRPTLPWGIEPSARLRRTSPPDVTCVLDFGAFFPQGPYFDVFNQTDASGKIFRYAVQGFDTVDLPLGINQALAAIVHRAHRRTAHI